MWDTNPDIRQKQFEIIFSKTEEERLTMGLEMMEDMRVVVMRSIEAEKIGMSETERKIEFVKRYYKPDFTSEQMDHIIQWFKDKQ